MALESILGSAAYQDNSNNVQKGNVKSISVQNLNTDNTVVIGATETPAVTKSSNGQDNGNRQSGQQKYDPLVDAERLKCAITQANNKMKQTRTRCEFSYHEETNRVSIKVFDKETEEVIREIPPEESLEMLEKVWELAGLLVDERR